MNHPNSFSEHKKEAVRIATHQINLLITLASAFVVAPWLTRSQLPQPAQLLFQEGLLIFSIVCGYIATGCLAASVSKGDFDIDRTATRRWAIVQFLTYLVAMAVFIFLLWNSCQPS